MQSRMQSRLLSRVLSRLLSRVLSLLRDSGGCRRGAEAGNIVRKAAQLN